MGKKHKKESRKRKHHSRSRSRSSERDQEKEKRGKHHKKHHSKDKKKDKCKRARTERSESSSFSEDEVVIVPDSPVRIKVEKSSPSPPKVLPPKPPTKEAKKEREPKKEDKSVAKVKASSPPPTSGGGRSADSLSIEETNALRAKLGLKPLQVDPPKATETKNGKPGSPTQGVDMGEFVHKPAVDLTAKKTTDKLKEKLALRKEKRQIEKTLTKTKTLGESSDSEEDKGSALSWIKKSRKIEEERKLAEKKAKELDEMDAEFGIGDLVSEEMAKEKSKVYNAKHLKGLTVEHDIESFDEGKAVILTLKDNDVLNEDDGDTLVNVNMVDNEKYKKNIENKKQNPFGYKAYDDDADMDEEKSVLKKYDEEIEGARKSKFVIGEEKEVMEKNLIKKKLQEKANKTLVSLELPSLQIASDYLNDDEMKAKFKKPKKVRKIRKKALKADDLLAVNGDVESTYKDLGSKQNRGSAAAVRKREDEDMDVDVLVAPPPPSISAPPPPTISAPPPPIISAPLPPIKTEEPDEETELEVALRKARRLKSIQKKSEPSHEKVVQLLKKEVKNEPMDLDDGSTIVLNSTAEFCRTLGDIPTYGLAGNREEALATSEFEQERKKKREAESSSEYKGGWNDVEMDERHVDLKQLEVPILDAEPDLGSGVAGALRLAMSKGYLEKESTSRPNAARSSYLQAQNYSIEDKTYADEERTGRRERYMGPTVEFKEKDTYKPNIKLEYIDDDGHLLTAKEAFRYLSHKFHGKGPGKNKVEKRMKKNEQEGLMKQMSSTDTPLGTLNMLQQKQKETQSAYVVLSGSKHSSTPTAISKTKMK